MSYTATTVFSFTSSRPGPPPAIVADSFSHQIAVFINSLLTKNYSGVLYATKVDQSAPAGPSTGSASITASHAFPFLLQAELPESLFANFWTTAGNVGWVISDRTILTTPTP